MLIICVCITRKANSTASNIIQILAVVGLILKVYDVYMDCYDMWV